MATMIYIYIYIYILCVYICIYIYIYITRLHDYIRLLRLLDITIIIINTIIVELAEPKRAMQPMCLDFGCAALYHLHVDYYHYHHYYYDYDYAYYNYY